MPRATIGLGVITSSRGYGPVREIVKDGVLLAPEPEPEDQMRKCVGKTRAGSPCKREAKYGDLCAGHQRELRAHVWAYIGNDQSKCTLCYRLVDHYPAKDFERNMLEDCPVKTGQPWRPSSDDLQPQEPAAAEIEPQEPALAETEAEAKAEWGAEYRLLDATVEAPEETLDLVALASQAPEWSPPTVAPCTTVAVSGPASPVEPVAEAFTLPRSVQDAERELVELVVDLQTRVEALDDPMADRQAELDFEHEAELAYEIKYRREAEAELDRLSGLAFPVDGGPTPVDPMTAYEKLIIDALYRARVQGQREGQEKECRYPQPKEMVPVAQK